jgi:hypothetical protein
MDGCPKFCLFLQQMTSAKIEELERFYASLPTAFRALRTVGMSPTWVDKESHVALKEFPSYLKSRFLKTRVSLSYPALGLQLYQQR